MLRTTVVYIVLKQRPTFAAEWGRVSILEIEGLGGCVATSNLPPHCTYLLLKIADIAQDPIVVIELAGSRTTAKAGARDKTRCELRYASGYTGIRSKLSGQLDGIGLVVMDCQVTRCRSRGDRWFLSLYGFDGKDIRLELP